MPPEKVRERFGVVISQFVTPGEFQHFFLFPGIDNCDCRAGGFRRIGGQDLFQCVFQGSGKDFHVISVVQCVVVFAAYFKIFGELVYIDAQFVVCGPFMHVFHVDVPLGHFKILQDPFLIGVGQVHGYAEMGHHICKRIRLVCPEFFHMGTDPFQVIFQFLSRIRFHNHGKCFYEHAHTVLYPFVNPAVVRRTETKLVLTGITVHADTQCPGKQVVGGNVKALAIITYLLIINIFRNLIQCSRGLFRPVQDGKLCRSDP